MALEFLQNLVSRNCSYSQINTTCSAMSAIIDYGNPTFGKLLIVKRFFKGTFELKPTFPRHCFIWDVSKVFSYFRSLPNPDKLSLKVLTQKLVMLMLLLSGGQRAQTIHCICTEDLKIYNDTLYIPVMSKIKQSKARQHMEPLCFKKYQDVKLCTLTHLNIYLTKTKCLRSSGKLFISYIKPHKAVTKDTISRWCKQVLKLRGIDVDNYTSHSCRSAASSKLKQVVISLRKVINSAGWSNERTFARFYDRPVNPSNNEAMINMDS